MNIERPCKHCRQDKNSHVTLRYRCDVDKLPLPWQEDLYTSDLAPWPTYEPMDNLEYLEHVISDKDSK